MSVRSSGKARRRPIPIQFQEDDAPKVRLEKLRRLATSIENIPLTDPIFDPLPGNYRITRIYVDENTLDLAFEYDPTPA